MLLSSGREMSGILDLDGLLADDCPEVRAHIEFDSRGVRAVRHADGLIAYTASPKAHLLLCHGLAVFD